MLLKERRKIVLRDVKNNGEMFQRKRIAQMIAAIPSDALVCARCGGRKAVDEGCEAGKIGASVPELGAAAKHQTIAVFIGFGRIIENGSVRNFAL